MEKSQNFEVGAVQKCAIFDFGSSLPKDAEVYW